MNKKAEGPIGFIFFVILFLINWALWFGEFLTGIGQRAITENNLTGIEAFMWANLNMWVFLVMILGIMAYLYLGGGD